MPKLNLFAISGLIVTITSATLIVFVAKELKTNKKLWPYFLHCSVVSLWGIGSFFIGITKDPIYAGYIWKLAYSAVILIATLYYHMILSLNDVRRKKTLIFLYSQATFFIFLTLGGILLSPSKLIFNSIYYVQKNIFFNLHFLIWSLIIISGYIELFIFYKKSVHRKQNFILLIGSIVAFAGGILNHLAVYGFPIYPIGNFFVAIYSLICAYAILQHQFLNIRIFIKKSIIYSILISIISIAYLITVLISERFLQGLVGYQSFLISGILTFGLGLFFIPLKNAIEMLVNRYFFKGSPEELSEQIEKFNQEVQQREKYKLAAQVVGNVAHEIKNPLTSIRTFIEQFPSKKNDPEFMDKFHKLTCNELERVQQLSLQLTDFARPEELKLSEFDIHACLDDVLMLVNNKLKHQDIRLIKQFVPGPLTLTADRDQIKQVLLNLVLNAMDAMPNGGTLTVTTNIIVGANPRVRPRDGQTQGSAPTDNHQIQISVSDIGSGISPEHQKKLFEPFFTTKPEGTGLGLNICQRIIKGHGGKIEVKSDLNKGTSFSIILPTNDASESTQRGQHV